MIRILQKNSATLRGKAKPIKLSDIGTPKINKILSDMKKAMDSEEDGVAIAAPQIGVPLRIFVVSSRIFDILKESEKANYKLPPQNDLVFLNPEIKRLSKEKSFMEEGCLSVRWLYGKVPRAKKAKITAYNEHGVKFELGASGLLAQIFQHETDHLDGILFIDKAKEVEEIPPEKWSERKDIIKKK
ncbi:MAG: peptide deformylase [Patescibacteria group bacterium]